MDLSSRDATGLKYTSKPPKREESVAWAWLRKVSPRSCRTASRAAEVVFFGPYTPSKAQRSGYSYPIKAANQLLIVIQWIYLVELASGAFSCQFCTTNNSWRHTEVRTMETVRIIPHNMIQILQVWLFFSIIGRNLCTMLRAKDPFQKSSCSTTEQLSTLSWHALCC